MEKNGKKGLFSFWDHLPSFGLKREVTQEEIETMIDSGQKTGLIDEEENEMIHRIFELKDIVVREVMVPRTEIKALEINAHIGDVAKMVVEEGHSRLPIFKETVDNVVGIIYAKDLLKFWDDKGADIKIKDVMRKPLFVPETKGIEDLFKDLKSKRIHIAIVVDEYGGTAGLVTIEDLIEEIVGDIQDEHDVVEEEFKKVGQSEYLVDARIDIDDLAERLDFEIIKDDFDTLGGFIAHLSNKIPSLNEEINYKNLTFKIIEADERKVSKINIKVLPVPVESASGGEPT